ncbi:MAG TPA: phosphoglycerate dehydrogenase [Candidatus Acidoferrales bacterium]|nr:phosphoglycerate dehydrogenase [Candidatus Acidoferrales bacterium]
MKVLVTDPIEQICTDILQKEGIQVDAKPGLPPDEIKKIIASYDGLIVRSGTKVTADIISAANGLKVIGRAGAGVDNIDVPAATRKGIVVLNTPGGNTISTAEHTMALMMALARNIPQAFRDLQGGKWERKKYTGTELMSKTLGVIGLGKVGREVATRAKAFGMNIIGYDPLLAADIATKLGIELVSLDEIYRRSDFITVHTPLTEETRGILGDKAFSACKQGVRVINCARGGIIDEDALLKALESGKVAGAAFDVFVKEPPGDHPLLKHPKVIATPHLGASTEEAQEKVAKQIGEELADFFKGRGIVGAVNIIDYQSAVSDELRAYLVLAEKIGSLHAQLLTGKVKSITASYRGALLQNSCELLSTAVLKGLLDKMMYAPVNFVNAALIAKEMGISVSEKKDQDGKHHSHLLSVEVQTEDEEKNISGTVFGTSEMRVVGIDGFHFEIAPEGHLLFYSNKDRPGMLAAVGSLLASANINIAGMSLGRSAPGEKALAVMSVDGDIPEPVLKEISKISGVFEVKAVKL